MLLSTEYVSLHRVCFSPQSMNSSVGWSSRYGFHIRTIFGLSESLLEKMPKFTLVLRSLNGLLRLNFNGLPSNSIRTLSILSTHCGKLNQPPVYQGLANEQHMKVKSLHSLHNLDAYN